MGSYRFFCVHMGPYESLYRVSVKLLYSLTRYYTVSLHNTVLQVTIKANNFYDKYSNWRPSAPIHSRQRDTTL